MYCITYGTSAFSPLSDLGAWRWESDLLAFLKMLPFFFFNLCYKKVRKEETS